MKKTKILYWVFTVIFGGFMLFSGIMNAIITPDSVVLVTDQLGYPQYLIPFLGVAKILGALAILIPGFPRLKEWAYAGLFFDLIGATFSFFATTGFKPEHLGMLMFFVPGVLSYIYYHKKLKGE
jgi:uncharacterized membrane protein YphA (DoxX/SURF4 family)